MTALSGADETTYAQCPTESESRTVTLLPPIHGPVLRSTDYYLKDASKVVNVRAPTPLSDEKYILR